VKVDPLRPRAKVSIIGEFWAMTTEGDGNYQLQRFVESEGGECDIQLTTAWLLYNIWEVSRDTRERRDLKGIDDGSASRASPTRTSST
jgi:predicted nucleotide-binding protein (sugar kinase/HSP70/actin superfamily)